MRKRKTEDIRRLVVAAINTCDLSGLTDVKRKLISALNELSVVDSNNISSKNSSSPPQKNNFPKPLESLSLIEKEIKKESEKISNNNSSNLLFE